MRISTARTVVLLVMAICAAASSRALVVPQSPAKASVPAPESVAALPIAPVQEPTLQIGGPNDLSTVEWRIQCGDNPAWASPDFDDSHWYRINPKAPLPNDVVLLAGKICWYRATVNLAPGSESLALFVGHTFFMDYDLYWNGNSIGGTGGLPPGKARYARLNGVYPLPGHPSATGGRQTIAIRVWRYADFGFVASAPELQFTVQLGSSAQLDALWQNTILMQLTYIFIGGPGIGFLVGLLALGLFTAQRERKEYLWLGIYGLSFAASSVISLVSLAPAVSVIWTSVLNSIFVNLIPVAFIEFFYAFLGRPPGKWIRAYECTFAAPVLLYVAGVFGKVNIALASTSSNLLFLPGTAVLVAFLFIESRRKNPEAAILVLPTFLAVGSYDFMTILFFLIYFHAPVAWLMPFVAFHIGFLPVGVYPVCLSLFWLSTGVIIVRRHSRDTQEKARLNAEFSAARNVQQMLIPLSAVADSSFHTECVYLPASEVGGDFYRLLPAEDGSLLVVVGDVSGKGMSAAMTVSTIIGALRGFPLRSPSLVLAHLNSILAGQISGFVTCCAALISAEGEITLANAGHIPPYCNGRQMDAESGLPLGLLDGIVFEEVYGQFHPGDRLTFVSDGVIEATNSRRELFGFDRTQEISARSASEIAETARTFGQEDDITVLVVQLAAVSEPESIAAAH